MFYCFLQLYNKVNLRWLPHGQGSITSPINIINTNSFATITCYAWISNAILFFYIHYRNVHHLWWCLLPIFDLNDMVIFPIASGLGNKRGADILHANMNYRLDVNISLAKLHILSSSVVFQSKAYPLNFLCLETLNIFFLLWWCVLLLLQFYQIIATHIHIGLSSGSVAGVIFVQKRCFDLYGALEHKALRLYVWEA